MELTVCDVNGPLFVLAEVPATLAFLSAHYPQFAKRSLGWQLTVEELHCVQAPREASGGVEGASAGSSCAPSPPDSAPAAVVTFNSAGAAAQYETMQQRYAQDCFVYQHLTRQHGYKLRHGSAFGANYIGYQDVGAHGECLFFVGPLLTLEQVRAARVAHSVGKRAMLVHVSAGDSAAAGSSVTVTEVTGGRAADASSRRKTRRKE